MRWGLSAVLAGVALIASSAALAQQRNFVACPIVRDTKTVPCFLAEYRGEIYFLGTQQEPGSELQAPQLKHELLVEGRASEQGPEGPRVCGGIPLEPVSISVMKEVNAACNTLLPAEPGIDAPAVRVAPAGSSRNLSSGAQEFTLRYSFDDDGLDYSSSHILTEAAEYAKRIRASTVQLTGFRATTLLSNGVVMVEKSGLAEKRAKNIAELLKGLGVTGVTVEWKSDAEPGDGRTDAGRRRVNISVTP